MSTTTLHLAALAGSPNCGKTALFNALTGSRQKVANYPGVTVERKEGVAKSTDGRSFRLLDLPGAYSLTPNTPDEAVTRDVLFGKLAGEAAPEVLVAVADATNLERHLSFVLELRALKQPVVLALNMIDLAKKRGLELDLPALSRELGVPVVPTAAVRGEGVADLMATVEKLFREKNHGNERPAEGLRTFPQPTERFAEIDRILKVVVKRAARPERFTDRVDRVVLHPVWGLLVLLVTLTVIFQAVFTWASAPADAIEGAFGALGKFVTDHLAEGTLRSLIVDGVIAGVGGVLVFLPQILLLFLFILFLEDFGYMARVAFLLDKLMGGVGLHGRAFIPLLSSHACAIPGIMATRTIENRRDRLVTILIAPLTACSARLPVYTLLIGAFIPNTEVFGPFRLQGLVMLGLYFAGILAALAVATLMKRTVLQGPKPPFLLEMPMYKLPSLKSLAIGLWERARIFVKRAGTVILSLTVILWFLASFPKAPEGATEPAIYYSWAGQIGRAVEPVFQPIGFDWRVSVALIPGFAAREVMVGALGTVYAIEGEGEAAEAALGARLATSWSLATALSLLVWYIFAPQCLSTLAVTRRETNSWRWPVFMLVYLTALAYLGSFITYRLALMVFS
ncbi:MAG: ferrous iron transport protein B [Bacteriovoracia bacterium]